MIIDMRFALFLFLVLFVAMPLTFTGVLFFAENLGLVEVDWNEYFSVWFSVPSALKDKLYEGIQSITQLR